MPFVSVMNDTLDYAAIADQLKLHDRAMGASSCGITIADAQAPDIPLIYINEAFTRLTGYTADDTLGRNCRFLQREDRDQPDLAGLRAALRAGRDCKVVIRNYRKDGTPFWNELFTSPVFDENGRLTHFIGVQTDVTERIDAQAALMERQHALQRALTELGETQALLLHSEKMNALGQMVAGVAHEINNPLSFVNSNLYSLQTTFEEIAAAYQSLESFVETEQRSAAFEIRQRAMLDDLFTDVGDVLSSSLNGLKRVKKIVDTLRTFSHLDEADLKVSDLRADVESALMIARLQLRDMITVVLDLDALPPIRCYPAELNQVFLNLIINAAHAMPDGGTLTIRGKEYEDFIEITFSDTGVGMTPDVMANIFHPFFTTKPVGTGTGLGLAIVHRVITERHRGRISVQSTPSAGSTFTLQLPKDIRP
jgi:PAS domain S-box-containing protein